MCFLKVDNKPVGHTGWGSVHNQCWDQRFSIDLERVRFLFTLVFCAVIFVLSIAFLRLHQSFLPFYSHEKLRFRFTGGIGGNCVPFALFAWRTSWTMNAMGCVCRWNPKECCLLR